MKNENGGLEHLWLCWFTIILNMWIQLWSTFRGPWMEMCRLLEGGPNRPHWHITIMFQIKHVSDICAVALNPRNVWTVYSPHGDISWSPLESTPAWNVPSLTFVLYVYFSSQIFLIEHIFIAWFFLLCWCWRRWRRKQEHFHEPS